MGSGEAMPRPGPLWGMGLGLFPQLALSLPRVESVHIVDVDPDIIELIQETWKRKPWPRSSACTASASPIEDYLKNTEDAFDKVSGFILEPPQRPYCALDGIPQEFETAR